LLNHPEKDIYRSANRKFFFAGISILNQVLFLSEPEKFEFKAEIDKLLHILSQSLYQHKEVFLRELVSNAADALTKIKYIQLTDKDVEELPLEIEIGFNSKEKTITIHDAGIGMTKQELVDNLGTIAGSDSEKFYQRLKSAQETEGKKEIDLDIIGQFGVGFYSVFMVAQKVRVVSKSYKPDEPANAWESEGTGEFTVEPAEREKRGTDVIIYLKEDEAEYAAQYRLREIVKKYSNYIPFPIFIKEEGKTEVDVSTDEEAEASAAAEPSEEAPTVAEGEEASPEGETPAAPKKAERMPVNELVPIWKKKPADITEDEYKSFYHFVSGRYDEYSQLIHYNVDGQVQFNSIYYIPATQSREFMQRDVEYGLALYSKKVLIIQHCKDLIPQWMRFVTGIVDSEDIPLNVSRDTIQNNRVIAKISDLIVKKFLSELETMAEKEPEKYESIWKEYSYFFKEGMVSEHALKDRLLALLRFHTSTTPAGWRSLADYIKDMPEAQQEKKEIYYLVGENVATMKISPHMGQYNKTGTEVIFFTEPVDNFLMMNIGEYKTSSGEGDEKTELTYRFVPIDTAAKKKKQEKMAKEGEESEGEQPKEEELSEEAKAFLERVKAVLGNKIMDAKMSSELYDSPFRLANPSEGMTSSMQRVMRYWSMKQYGKEFEIPRKVFEFNPAHPMVQELVRLCSEDPENGRIKPVIMQAFDNCLLVEGDLPDASKMVPRVNQLLEMVMLRNDDVPNPAEGIEDEEPEGYDHDLGDEELNELDLDDETDGTGEVPPEEPSDATTIDSDSDAGESDENVENE